LYESYAILSQALVHDAVQCIVKIVNKLLWVDLFCLEHTTEVCMGEMISLSLPL